MKTYNLDDIRALNPCYDPEKHLPEGWTGTIPDGLRLENIPAEDRIWVAAYLVDKRTARLFAVWCARTALAAVQDPDPRCVAACDIAERYAHGQASDEELAAAWAAARAAAWAAARAAAWAAEWAAEWAAAGAAAWAAAWAAEWAAARAAVLAARHAAGHDGSETQINKLIEMIEETEHE